jgi:hypothetical protein
VIVLLNEYKIDNDICTVFIKRRNGEVMEMIIDIEDITKFDLYGKITVQYNKTTQGYYAVCGTIGVSPIIRMQVNRLIMNCPKHLVTDHINHDTLDNRKQNLRNVTQRENLQNRISHYESNDIGGNKGIFEKPQKNHSYKYGIQGLTWNKINKQWRARIRKSGKTLYEKYFTDKEMAVQAITENKELLLQYNKGA